MVLEDSVFVHESLYETTSASDSFALGNINLQLGKANRNGGQMCQILESRKALPPKTQISCPFFKVGIFLIK